MFLRFLRTNTYTYTYYFEEESEIKNIRSWSTILRFDLIATVAFLQEVSKVGIRETFILKTTSIFTSSFKWKDNQVVPLDKN